MQQQMVYYGMETAARGRWLALDLSMKPPNKFTAAETIKQIAGSQYG
jgi:hypothetical protein